MKKKLWIVLGSVVLVVGLAFAALNFLTGGILTEAIFDRPSKPKVKHGEFPFELVYEYNNEQFTIKETLVCDFEGISFSLDGGNSRDWNCYITNNDNKHYYYLDEAKYPTLRIEIPKSADYYMGAPDARADLAAPYIFFIDESTGTTYYEQDLMNVVGARIISWEISEPLVGNIKK